MKPTPQMIQTAGFALYGQEWKYPFGLDFGMSERRLRRVLKGEEDMGAEMWGRVMSDVRLRYEAARSIVEAA